MRRWLVERFFGWIQWQRRILIRWEYHAISLALSNLPASLSSSNDFEIGSSQYARCSGHFHGSLRANGSGWESGLGRIGSIVGLLVGSLLVGLLV
jgi:transposase